MTYEEKEELNRLCNKVVITFVDTRQMFNLMTHNNRFDYHESTDTFDLDILIRKRGKKVSELLGDEK